MGGSGSRRMVYVGGRCVVTVAVGQRTDALVIA